MKRVLHSIRTRLQSFFNKQLSSTEAAAGLFLRIGLGVVFAGLFVEAVSPWLLSSGWFGSLIFHVFDQLYSNFGIELVSVALTVLVIDRLNRKRDDEERGKIKAIEEKAREDERKASLILQMGSPDNAFAIEAVRQLRATGWLFDGTLVEANLQEANLQNATLQEANLQGVNLDKADLVGAGLQEANLQGASLHKATLEVADLYNANLRDAKLYGASLQYANLWKANLQGVRLLGANLEGANLEDANLTDATFGGVVVLPDGSYWSDERDMREFTDPEGWKAGKYVEGNHEN